MKTARVLWGILIIIFWTPLAHAQIPGMKAEKPVTIGGYVKGLASANVPKSGPTSQDQIIHQRFNMDIRAPRDLLFHAGLRTQVIHGDSPRIPGFNELIARDEGYWDFTWEWLNNDDAAAVTSLDRFYADWTYDHWKISGGRQRIYWGMAQVWNPNDIFNAYSIYDFDYEERRGTDSVLIGRDFGFAGLTELVWALGDDWDQTSLAGRTRFNFSGYDAHVIYGKNQRDLVGGGGFAGSLGGAGFRGEVTVFDPYQDNEPNAAFPQNSSTIATLESDYSFASQRNWTVKGDILYISNPTVPGSAAIYLNQSLTARTLSFTEWTGYAETGFDITSLSRQTFALNGYDDGSWFIFASNAISLANEWELFFIWQHYGGDSNSVFGADPSDLLFTRLRWSF